MSDLTNHWDSVGVLGLTMILAGVVVAFIRGLLWLHTHVAELPLFGWLFIVGLLLLMVGILFGEQ